MDIKLKVKEKGKQSISFSGGVSGIAGTFISLSYQTNNFLGLGETLTISGQLGNLQQGATFGFTEPYFLTVRSPPDSPIFYSKFNYNQAKQEGLLLGPAGRNRSSTPAELHDRLTRFHDFCQLSFAKVPFHRVGVTYGFLHDKHHRLQPIRAIVIRVHSIPSSGGPLSVKRNSVQQDYSDDFLQHRR